jgi:DNA-directed RNA polymerase specialized sigma24 family protein
VEIALLLADGAGGDKEKAKRGLELVYQLWGRPILSLLRAVHAPSELSKEDFWDLWHETMHQLAVRIRNGGLRREGSLFSLVTMIAKRLAARHVHQCTTRRTAPLFDELEDTRDGRGWADLNQFEREELLELAQRIIPTLSPKIRTVIQVFIRHFPETESMERLRERVSEVTGREETLAAVKRALQDAREGLRSHMQRKGYDFRTGGDR